MLASCSHRVCTAECSHLRGRAFAPAEKRRTGEQTHRIWRANASHLASRGCEPPVDLNRHDARFAAFDCVGGSAAVDYAALGRWGAMQKRGFHTPRSPETIAKCKHSSPQVRRQPHAGIPQPRPFFRRCARRCAPLCAPLKAAHLRRACASLKKHGEKHFSASSARGTRRPIGPHTNCCAPLVTERHPQECLCPRRMEDGWWRMVSPRPLSPIPESRLPTPLQNPQSAIRNESARSPKPVSPLSRSGAVPSAGRSVRARGS